MKRKVSPIAWVPSVYFAAGLPFVVLNMVVVLMYKGLDVSNATITFWTSLIMLPWTLKPLWSPFMELYKTKKFYVVTTELFTGVMFGLVALSLTMSDFFAASICGLALIAFSGATHDIAGDGVYMSELTNSQQSKYIGWQGAFYNIAKIVGTGLLVWLAGTMGEIGMGVKGSWMTVLCIVAILMVMASLYNAWIIPSAEAGHQNASAGEVASELKKVILDFFTKKYIWYYIAFIILYRFAEGFVIKIVPIFLKTGIAEGGLGLSDKAIGLYYGTFGAAAFVIGSILGGYFISHYGLKKTLFTLALIFNIPFAVYTLLAIYQPSAEWLIASGIVLEYFGYGFGFVGLTLFMMQQVAPGKHQMAHYAFASGIMNLGVMLPGMFSGWLCDEVGGFRNFFIIVLVMIIVPLAITWFIPFTYDTDPKKVKEGVDAALTGGEGTE